MDTFVDHIKNENPDIKFWWNYMEMVNILLYFIRAQRDGLWDLHLFSFRKMLTFFFRYDHTNYARSVTVYLAEMNRLPEEIDHEFMNGNFVVKESDQSFNQVDPDHSQEWLNAIGKKNSGIVRITKTASALSRWALSYNLRTQIAKKTKEMLMIDNENDDYIHNECGVSKKKKDEAYEGRIIEVLQRLNMFGTSSTTLQDTATKDLASSDIESSLLDAEKLGREQFELFVKERIIRPIDGKQRIGLTAPLARNKALTFASLYTVSTDVGGKPATIKADRNILQRLVTADRSGRPVNLDKILKHELLPVPVALSSLNGTLNTGNISILADILSCSISTPQQVAVTGSASLVIDGQALINAIGKPSGAKTVLNSAHSVIVYARDTDILVLLLAHFEKQKLVVKSWYVKETEIFSDP